MPRVLIEAMSRGLTALGSIIGDIPEQMTAMAKNIFSSKEVPEGTFGAEAI